MSTNTTHVRGFYDADGKPYITSASSEIASPHEVYERVARNVTYFGGCIEERAITRDLDGWLVGVEFQTPERDGAMRMWHRIFRADSAWLDAPSETSVA